MIAVDAYLSARAWQAWYTGLVSNGNVTAFDELLPAHDDSENRLRRDRPQSEVEMAHNMAMWRSIFGLKAVPIDDDGRAGDGG